MNTIVVGSLHTDLVSSGLAKFPDIGENVYAQNLSISAGGKSRNIAEMIAKLTPNNSVAMVSRTVRDPYNLWGVPLKALNESGVNTEFVKIASTSKNQLPGIAFIPVDRGGNNLIFISKGASADFSPDDIDAASDLFEQVGRNRGMLVATLESPVETLSQAFMLAEQNKIKIMLDPGGAEKINDVTKILDSKIYLIKPNAYETKMLTGVDVVDLQSAKKAGRIFSQTGIENTLITAGRNGAYLICESIQKHLPIKELSNQTEKDETGCGDQVMATLSALIQQGKTLETAAEIAITAGTKQFYRSGIVPLTFRELANLS